MNSTFDRYTLTNGVANAGAETQEVGAPGRFAAWLAVFLVIALGLSAWLFALTGVPDVSAAADARSTPQVPYFPSQYVNQATEIEPPIATF